MKMFLKRSLFVILAITIIFGSAAVGLGEVDFSGLFSVGAHAASNNYLSFNPSYDGRYMLVSGCNKNATGEIVIPYEYGGVPVKSIGNAAFEDCTNITSIIMHEAIDYINSNAFRNCTGLTSITIPDKVTRICDSIFAGCTNLKSIVIPDGVTSICSSAFAGTAFYNNEDNWVNNVLYIDNYLIKARDALSGKFTIRNGAKIIADSAFEDCTKLTSIEIPDSVTSIGSGAFSDCENLMSVTILNNMTSIGYNAFYNTGYYNNSDNWKNNVLYIDNHLIEAEIDLSGEYIIKNGTKTIADSAFKGCTSLESVTIPDSVTKIGESAFSGCRSLTSVTIGDGVTSIGDSAFSGCTSITSVTIGNSVTGIGVSAFSGCYNLASITIPVSVTSIGESAFGWCHNLADVYYGGTEYDWEIIIIGPRNYELGWATIHYHEHSYNGDWIIDTEATVNNAGSKHKECPECGEVLETDVIPQLKPATPKATTTNEANGIKVSWNAVGGAVKYNVYRRQAGQTAWTLVGTTTGTSLIDTKVTSGIYYCYSVRAYNNANQYSDYVAAKTQNRKFMAVPELTGISNATNGLYIKWNAVNGNGRVEYRVYRRGAGQTAWTYLGTTTNTYWTDKGVKNSSGNYYRYTVRAVQGTNGSGWYSAFDTTGLYLKRLANPTLKSATSAKAGITVKWDAVAGTTGYYVYRKTANSGWTRIAAVGGTNTTSYLDKTAKKGITYTYTVRAVYGSTTSYFNSGTSCKDLY